MAKNITIIPASGSINFISSGSSSTIELLITGSNNEILTFYTGSTPILSINSTSGFSTAQPPSFNNLSSVPSSSNYIVYDTGSGAISYTTGVGGSGTSGTSGATGTSGTSGTGSPGTSGTSGNSGTSGISGSSGSSGTSADLSAYVPYTGSTTSVNLGANNLTVDTNTFFVDATNNRVGIGTATPNNTLTVSSNSSSYSNAGFISQFYQGTNNTDVKLMIADASNFISLTYGGTTTSNTQWAGFIMGSGNAAFRVWGSDNVGIGYTNGNLVTNKFQVTGSSKFEGTFTVGSNSIYSLSGSTKVSFGTTTQNYQFTLYATGNDNRLHFLNNSTGTAITDGTFLGLDDGINFSLWQRENGYIRLATNETERLRITGAGLVGIGTTASAAILHVNSSGGATDLFRVDLAGVRRFRITSGGTVTLISNNTGFYEGASTGFDFSNTNAPAAAQSAYNFYGRTSTNATGESTHFDMGGKNIAATTGFASATGSGTWIGARLDYTINNTGTYSGTVTGLYLNATETSITGTTHNLLNLLVGGSSRFRVNNAGNVTAAAATFSGNLVVDTNTFVVDATNNRVGIGTATPSFPLDIISTATNQLVLQSTGTATDSRASMLFSNDRASFASVAAFLYGNTTNTTSKLGQTMADKFFIIADGANNLGMAIGTNGSVPLFLATDNTTRLTVTSGGLLAFGTGTTSAFPALKRNSTELQVRLADDSGFAPFQSSQLTISAGNIITDTTTGMKIGTANNQKLGFWNATPIIQPIVGGSAASFVANTSLIANDTATFDGYTIGQVVKALRDMGILA
jgi:hypothetical protein